GTDDGPREETNASPEAQYDATSPDSPADGDAEPGITPVDDEEGPVEESDALVSNAGEPIEASESVDVANAVEPGGDPVFDREAEQLALDAAEDELTEHATSTPEESGPAIFGCNVPLGGSDVIGGEYALLGVGLLGLGFRRPMGALRDMLWPALR
ncbi:MAG: hypothetical protein IIC30_06445, partial [Chloroflexi bacterium]|nr:hypothetical protein [Chloroflexota bacterium]